MYPKYYILIKIFQHIISFIIVLVVIIFLTLYYIFNFRKKNRYTQMFKEFEFRYLFVRNTGMYLLDKLKDKIKKTLKNKIG